MASCATIALCDRVNRTHEADWIAVSQGGLNRLEKTPSADYRNGRKVDVKNSDTVRFVRVVCQRRVKKTEGDFHPMCISPNSAAWLWHKDLKEVI